MRKFMMLRAIPLAILLLFFTALAISQDSPQSKSENESTIEGTVISTSHQTMVVKTDDNEFHLFVFDRYSNRPKTIAVGTRVRVVSKPGDEEGTRLASTITALEAAPNATSSNASGGATETRATSPPPAVRDLESNIKNEARRWHLGVRAGAALDPELFMFGVHSQIGPIFNRNVFFRPSAEFAFGEVTDLIALNLEAIYRLPVTARGKNWSAYVGAGPALTFIHQNFEHEQGQGRNIDFGNFDYETGFNILTGFQRRHTFFEIKTSLYSRPAPTLRLIVGYTF
jgi:hypothetical protein